ncbi:MAG: aminotransferase class V-fold PLP-dependent enzyme [Ruminiclostridium sp.]|nr:aminotransferase class V-fold PLP-dependent enzyme [Ruminiclostridium sp.]
MIYFDNAATTYPKPPAVIAAMSRALVRYGANPGRAGHAMSLETADAVFRAREKCAEFFGAEVENTIFMPNCTFALNTAIKGILGDNSHAVTSDIEHNAVLRPLYALSKSCGVSFTFAESSDCDDITVGNFAKCINRRTKAVICTLAGNVTGKIMPVRRIGELCAERGICFIVDAAQGAGVLPIKLGGGINIICAAGHKGLYGPMGTGLLVTDGKYPLKTLVEGGTGSLSKDLNQPTFLPDRFESGTINTAGAISLGAGVDFVLSKGIDVIEAHERGLCSRFFAGMKKLPSVKLYSDSFDSRFAPVIPFNIGDIPAEEVSEMLSRAGFALRGGFHCAFPAHNKIGTSEQGAVRFSPSVFNTVSEVNALIRAAARIAVQSA